MNKKKELAKNTVIIFFGRVCTQLISFFLLPLYTSYLSTSEYGTVDLIQTYVTLLVPIITLELEMSIFRYLIDCRGKEKDTNKLVLEDKTKVDNIYSIDEVPILINTVDSSEYDYFIKKISKVDSNILLKISEIEYAKVDVDKQRFLLYMNDGNYVYITLSKIDNLNKYEEIYNSLEGKKGIIYLDSGNYFEEAK